MFFYNYVSLLQWNFSELMNTIPFLAAVKEWKKKAKRCSISSYPPREKELQFYRSFFHFFFFLSESKHISAKTGANMPQSLRVIYNCTERSGTFYFSLERLFPFIHRKGFSNRSYIFILTYSFVSIYSRVVIFKFKNKIRLGFLKIQ